VWLFDLAFTRIDNHWSTPPLVRINDQELLELDQYTYSISSGWFFRCFHFHDGRNGKTSKIDFLS
jgi:hypothetical protein